MSKKSVYRCSLCNMVRLEDDQKFVTWDLDVDEDEIADVAICKSCVDVMAELGFEDCQTALICLKR